MTINCRERGGNQLIQKATFHALRDAAGFYHGRRWWVHLWLCMPNHLHALLSFPDLESMKQVISDWKRYTARTTGIKWQFGFFDHRLRHDESYEEKAHYILMNPARAGLRNKIEDWPFVFAAGNFDRNGSSSQHNLASMQGHVG